MGPLEIPLNACVGKSVTLTATGNKQCIGCGKATPKTFQQGYCFPCTQKLAQTDLCMVKPELCHFHKGTCRDADFAQRHCFIPHTVYLAVSSHAKVGITREPQKLTRWADQGASYALEVLRVNDRKTAGEIEVKLSKHLSDKTNWRKMLTGEIEHVDLFDLKQKLLAELADGETALAAGDDLFELSYPVAQYPQKITSLSFDKTPKISGELWGIKGQYLIFAHGVINLRKYQGYEVEWAA